MLSGGRWTIQTAPLSGLSDGNASEPLSSGDLDVFLGGSGCSASEPCNLSGVSCPTVTFCAATGTYHTVDLDTSGVLIETYQAGKWTSNALPALELNKSEMAQLPITLDEVECPRTGEPACLWDPGQAGTRCSR